MILLHKLNGDEFMLNDRHIEKIEEKPDTVITLTNEKIYIVKESTDEILEKIKEFKLKSIEKLRSDGGESKNT